MKLSTFLAFVCLAVGFALAADIVDNAAIIKMTKGHVPEPIILKMIATQQTRFEFSPEKMIELTQAGVSESVISAMVSHSGEAQPQEAPQATSLPSFARTGFGGVELRLKVTHEVSSKHAHEGDSVEFTLLTETKVGNRVLPAGSKASGHVRISSHKGLAGAPGQLVVMADNIKAPDGIEIHIVGFLNGDSGPIISGKDVAVRIFDPLARGRDATVKEGTEFTVRTQD